MVDIKTIKSGDEVTIRGTFDHTQGLGESAVVRFKGPSGEFMLGVMAEDIITTKARKFVPGDIVTTKNAYGKFKVISLNGKKAWLESVDDFPGVPDVIERIENLSRA